MEKYKQSIKKNLNKLVGKDLAKKIFEANFPKPTKKEVELNKKHARIVELCEKGIRGEKLTKKEIKELGF